MSTEETPTVRGGDANPWLRRFALLTALTTLGLIAIGGLVTSHGVGMAVPDWPNTYGYNLFLFPFSKWLGGIFYEHTHRLAAALVGLLTTILAIWMWVQETRTRQRWLGVSTFVLVLVLMGVRQLPVYIALACLTPLVWCVSFWRIARHPNHLRWWGVIAFSAVILQGVLGGLRVVLFKDELGIFHAALAQLFFVLLCAIALFAWEQRQARGIRPTSLTSPSGSTRDNRRFAIAVCGTTLLMFCQLLIGATMRHQHAGLAIPDFPLAYGKIWPTMDAASVTIYNQQRMEITAVNPLTRLQIGLQMAHRIMAVLIFAAVAWCAWGMWRRQGARSPLTRLGLAWFALICAQVVLGAATIWSNKAADIATAHVVVGALSLVTGAMLSIISFRVAIFAPGKVSQE